MKLKAILLLFLALILTSTAQVQQGIVKTKGRLNTDGSISAGIRLDSTLIKVHKRNAVISNTDGTFSFPIPDRTFYFEKIQKKGYQLVDPDFITRSFSFSSNPLLIVLETPNNRLEDELLAERKMRQILMNQLLQREQEIEQLLTENQITKEEYYKKFQELYNSQENNEKLIKNMVEYYSKIDYDQLNEENQLITTYILNGELTKADSIINAKGNLEVREAAFLRYRETNNKEENELCQRQAMLTQSKLYEQKELENLAQDRYHKYEICKLQYINDSAAYHIIRRAELDTTNVSWQLEAGIFICDYTADYNTALSLFQRALHNASQQTDVALSYTGIGTVYLLLGDYNKASKYNTLAIDIFEKQKYKNLPIIAISYNNIGSIYNAQSEYELALQYYYKALNIYINRSSENDPDIAYLYNNIGMIYRSLGDYDKALEFIYKGLNIQLNQLNKNQTYIANIYNNIGLVLNSQQNYDEALKYCEKALNILIDKLGERHPDVAACYNNIGEILSSQGDYDKALIYYKKALNISINKLGEKHPLVATSYNGIGEIYLIDGNYEMALKYSLTALNILIDKFGEAHSDVAACYNNIGGIYYSQGDYDKALIYCHKALNIQTKKFSKNQSNIIPFYKNIERLYILQDNYEMALKYNLIILNILMDKFEKNYLYIANEHINISMIYNTLCDYKNALIYCRKALDILVNNTDKENIYIANTYRCLGEIYNSQGDSKKALKYLHNALRIYKQNYGADDINLISLKQYITNIEAKNKEE